MHAVIMESLEEILSGSLDPVALRETEGHLATCPSCREEVRAMQDLSGMFVSLRADEVVEPAPGFYSRVVEQVGRSKPAPWFAHGLWPPPGVRIAAFAGGDGQLPGHARGRPSGWSIPGSHSGATKRAGV